jgi:hypothetical protein
MLCVLFNLQHQARLFRRRSGSDRTQEKENTGMAAHEPATMTFDLIAHIYRQRAFSRATFGPGARLQGVVDHIRKECGEIERKPSDLFEWIDVILLAIDGAWRAGHTPEQIAAAIGAKQGKNELRDWPDWRTADPNKAIEHNRTPKAPPREYRRPGEPDWLA